MIIRDMDSPTYTAFQQSTFFKGMQITSTTPALPKAPTTQPFSVVPAKFPVLAGANTLAGDVVSNPGGTKYTQTNLHQHPKTQNAIETPQATGISILQSNINGITEKQEELKQLAYTTQPDITIQETKLTTTFKTHKIPNYTPIRTDRVEKLEGELQ